MQSIFKGKPKKQAGNRATHLPFYKKKGIVVGSAIFVLLCMSCVLLGIFYQSSIKKSTSHLTEVIVVGQLHYLDRNALYAMMKPEVGNKFFLLNINKLKKTVLSQAPWASTINIRRAWPRKLVVKVEEHLPKAIWNYKGIIDTQGRLIMPELTDFHEVLPLLIGPEDKLPLVWKHLIDYDAILTTTGHKIVRLELAQRGSWRFRLDNGMQVILGTHEKKQRLHRFVKAYNQSLKKDQASIAYVDMRYTTGMAVGLKAL